jgi:hypothetical protein
MMISIFFLLFVLPKAIYPLALAKEKSPVYWMFWATLAFLIGEGFGVSVLFGLDVLVTHFQLSKPMFVKNLFHIAWLF